MTAAAVTVDGSVEDFVQKVTMKAMAGLLDQGEEKFLRERVEADIAALEWVKLAQKAGALKLTEDIVALGGELRMRPHTARAPPPVGTNRAARAPHLHAISVSTHVRSL